MKNPKNGLDKKLLFLSSLICCLCLSLTAFAATYGDVNNDSNITIVDAMLTAQYSAGLNPAGFVAEAADVSGDGQITINDALLIARYTANLITQFPAVTPVPTPTPTLDCYGCERTETGTVKNQAGQPIAGASIYELNYFQATTDAQGNFSYTTTGIRNISGCPAGDTYIFVKATGYNDASKFIGVACNTTPNVHPFVLSQATPTPIPSSTPSPTLTCPSCTRTETGMVKNQSGQPVAGVSIYEGSNLRASTDAQGYFSYNATGTSANSGCPATTLTITFKATGYLDYSVYVTTSCIESPRSHTIVLYPQ